MDWTKLAEKRLKALTARARRLPAIRKLGPAEAVCWQIEVRMVGTPAMLRLNSHYRRKPYVTDVLSFPTPEIFRTHGLLGELVICVPVMKRQSKELGHAATAELEVLLAHGILHLLGLDHEASRKESERMARLEALLLGSPARTGLIRRSH